PCTRTAGGGGGEDRPDEAMSANKSGQGLRTAAEIDELINDLLFARKELSAEERERLFRESNAMTRASHLRDLFRMTGNRLLLWQIYRLYRAAELPIPEDVLREFDRIAEGLESASGPKEIASVLGLTGRKG